MGDVGRKPGDKLKKKPFWIELQTKEENHDMRRWEKKPLNLYWEEKRKNIAIVLYPKLSYEEANLRKSLPQHQKSLAGDRMARSSALIL